jgi:hypothetical protein
MQDMYYTYSVSLAPEGAEPISYTPFLPVYHHYYLDL